MIYDLFKLFKFKKTKFKANSTLFWMDFVICYFNKRSLKI